MKRNEKFIDTLSLVCVFFSLYFDEKQIKFNCFVDTVFWISELFRHRKWSVYISSRNDSKIRWMSKINGFGGNKAAQSFTVIVFEFVFVLMLKKKHGKHLHFLNGLSAIVWIEIALNLCKWEFLRIISVKYEIFGLKQYCSFRSFFKVNACSASRLVYCWWNAF